MKKPGIYDACYEPMQSSHNQGIGSHLVNPNYF